MNSRNIATLLSQQIVIGFDLSTTAAYFIADELTSLQVVYNWFEMKYTFPSPVFDRVFIVNLNI